MPARVQAKAGALGDIPPELAAGLLKALLAVVSHVNRATAAQIVRGDRRVRHDRIALPKRSALAAIRSGKLPAIKVGKFYYLEPEDLDRYYDAHRVEREQASAEAPDEFAQAMERSGLKRDATRAGRARR
jgi:hypothetical protein